MERLLRLVDYFSAPHPEADGDNKYRARVLSTALLVILLQSSSAFIYTVVATPFPSNNLMMAMMLPGPVVVGASLGLWALRKRGRLEPVCNLMLWMIALSISFSTIATGGPVTSGVSFSFVAIPVLALNVLGNKAALRWLAIVALIEAMLLAGELGFDAFNKVAAAQVISAHILVWLIVAASVTGFAWGSATYSDRLKQELRAEREKFQHLASHDSLTDLANRGLFAERLHQSLLRASRFNDPVLLLYIDLVDFKGINDRHGHQVGDLVLQIMSQRLKHSTRPTDTVARLGGDELAVILEGVTHGDAPTIIDALSEKLAQPCNGTPGNLVVRASIGAAIYPAHATAANALIAKADEAMYSAKRAGRPWCIWQLPQEPTQPA